MFTAIVDGRNVGHFMTESAARKAAMTVNPNGAISVFRI